MKEKILSFYCQWRPELSFEKIVNEFTLLAGIKITIILAEIRSEKIMPFKQVLGCNNV